MSNHIALWLTNIALENPPNLLVLISKDGDISMAMLAYLRVMFVFKNF